MYVCLYVLLFFCTASFGMEEKGSLPTFVQGLPREIQYEIIRDQLSDLKRIFASEVPIKKLDTQYDEGPVFCYHPVSGELIVANENGLLGRESDHFILYHALGVREVLGMHVNPQKVHELLFHTYDQMELFDLQTDQTMLAFYVNDHTIKEMAYDPHDTNGIATAGGKQVRIWDTRSGNCVQKLKKHAHRTTSISFNALRSYELVSAGGKQVCAWDRRMEKPFCSWKVGREVLKVRCNPHDADEIAIGQNWGTLDFFDTFGKKTKIHLPVHTGRVMALTYNHAHPGELACANYYCDSLFTDASNSIDICDTNKPCKLGSFKKEEGIGGQLAYHPHNPDMLTIGSTFKPYVITTLDLSQLHACTNALESDLGMYEEMQTKEQNWREKMKQTVKDLRKKEKIVPPAQKWLKKFCLLVALAHAKKR